MNRAVIVLTLPRSGSSAVAGALHRMGVNMGEGFFQPTDDRNPKGYYEDMRWRRVTNDLTGFRYSIEQPKALPPRHEQQLRSVISRCKSSPVWGVKDTRMVFVFPMVKPLIEEGSDLRVIAVSRNYEDTVESLMLHSREAYGGRYEMDYDRAMSTIDRWHDAFSNALEHAETGLEVTYEDLLNSTIDVLATVEGFVFEDMQEHSRGIDDAVAFIDPDLDHSSVEDPEDTDENGDDDAD